MNPFKPTAGKFPPILIGRQNIIDAYRMALDDGAGAPGRLMLINGQRGFGKTVMLTELSKIAAAHGWFVVSDTASEGLINRLISQLQAGMHVSKVDIQPSVSVGGFISAELGSARFEQNTQALTLRHVLIERLKKMKPGRGVLITVDEAQAANPADMVALATTFQQVLTDLDKSNEPDSDKRGISLVMAALPSLTDEVLHENVLTFLRRSMQFTLGDIFDAEVADAYQKTVTDSGKKISVEVAEQAAAAAGGYPYMIQLIGYYMWQHAQLDKRKIITSADVEYAIGASSQAFENAVCAPEFSALTEPQKEFLLAMAMDDVNSTKVTDVAERTGKSTSWASKYRKSLIDAQLIVAAGHGRVAFALPEMRKYLQSR